MSCLLMNSLINFTTIGNVPMDVSFIFQEKQTMTTLLLVEDIQENVYCSHCNTYEGCIYKNHETGLESFDCDFCGLSVEFPTQEH